LQCTFKEFRQTFLKAERGAIHINEVIAKRAKR
jgi:hypothetical protein